MKQAARVARLVSRESKQKKAQRLQLAQMRAGTRHVRESRAIREYLRKREERTKFVITPTDSKFMGYWDAVSGAALLWTALLTPVEVSFLAETPGLAALADPFFWVNRTLDTIFTADMLLQFFVAYETVSQETGARHWVRDSKLIRIKYLTTWFTLDFLTITLPLFFDLMTVLGGAKSLGDLSILRVMRILRLFKLVRLVKASRLMRRWVARISISHATVTMMQCGFMLLISAHWYACCMALQASLHSDPQATWMGEDCTHHKRHAARHRACSPPPILARFSPLSPPMEALPSNR